MTEFATASVVAEKIKPLLADAKRAYGSQPPGSPARQASEEVNAYILLFADNGGKIPDLAKELDGHISLSGLRRRVRIARSAEQAALEGHQQVVGRVSRPRGSTDPELVAAAAEKVKAAREQGGRVYGDAVREVYDEGVSLKAVAEVLEISSYSLWSARRTSW